MTKIESTFLLPRISLRGDLDKIRIDGSSYSLVIIETQDVRAGYRMYFPPDGREKPSGIKTSLQVFNE